MHHSSVPVLKSKIRVPALPQVCIERIELENRALAQPDVPSDRLVYLSAPPGYGKTTLLSRIARRFGGATAWVSLDPLDNDPRRLADHILAAINAARPALPVPGDDRVSDFAESGGTQSLMRALHTVELLGEPLLLILDDAHSLQNDAVFDALRAFLAYQPENCRVAIASREDLPLPISAHRQADRLVEFRVAEMRATDGEAAELLRQLEVGLDGPSLAGVLRKNAGWWSCLKLFAVSWHQRAPDERVRFLERFRGTSRFIAEFLLESLVSALPPDLREAAAVMAVPDFFNELLYTLLTGRDDCPRFVERLQQLNILGSRAAEGTARYRFHPLLRDYLRHQLPRSRRAEMHRMTARWFAENGLPDRAARHAQLAESLGAADALRSRAEASQTGTDHAMEAAAAGAHGQLPFSRRELELIAALADGLSNDQIAARLYISTGTVKWHLNNIYGKLGARSRTDALHKARSVGLVSD